jgi:hypothetical protein
VAVGNHAHSVLHEQEAAGLGDVGGGIVEAQEWVQVGTPDLSNNLTSGGPRSKIQDEIQVIQFLHVREFLLQALQRGCLRTDSALSGLSNERGFPARHDATSFFQTDLFLAVETINSELTLAIKTNFWKLRFLPAGSRKQKPLKSQEQTLVRCRFLRALPTRTPPFRVPNVKKVCCPNSTSFLSQEEALQFLKKKDTLVLQERITTTFISKCASYRVFVAQKTSLHSY